MSCWRVRNAADDVLPQPAAAGRRSSPPPPNKIMTCLYCLVIILGVLLCGFAVSWLVDDVAGHYVVEISIEASEEFRSIVADDGNTMMSSSQVKVEPSFDVTVRVENHYHHHICFSDWGVAVLRHDGAPLGRASFPDDLCLPSMGEGNVTAATASGLAGLAVDEARGQQTWEEVDLRIDMRRHVLLADSSADEWLRCTARLDGQPTAAPCQFEISSRS